MNAYICEQHSQRLDYMHAPELAKHIRKTLKARFPAQKFSVRSSQYAGGSSIDVSWTDGPTRRLVESIVKRWEGSNFDGMIDLKSSNHIDLNGKRIIVDFIFCNRKLSAAFLAKLVAIVGAYYNAPPETWPQVIEDQYDPRLEPRAFSDSPILNTRGDAHHGWQHLVWRASENRAEFVR